MGVLPEVAGVRHPVPCVVMRPVNVAVGSGIAVVWTVNVAARNVVMFVFATVWKLSLIHI